MPFGRLTNWVRSRLRGRKQGTTALQQGNFEQLKKTFLEKLSKAGKVDVHMLSQFDNLPPKVQVEVFLELVDRIDPSEAYSTEEVLTKLSTWGTIMDRSLLFRKISPRLTPEQIKFYLKLIRKRGDMEAQEMLNRMPKK